MTWNPYQRIPGGWSLNVEYPSKKVSRSDAEKNAYEERVLSLFVPAILTGPPSRVVKRESPDFQVITASGPLFIELVDAVPNVMSASGAPNLAERRAKPNSDTYQIAKEEVARVISEAIAGKQAKAQTWITREPKLAGHLALLVNCGQLPLALPDYYLADHHEVLLRVPIADIAPFVVVALCDGDGSFVWDERKAAGSVP